MVAHPTVIRWRWSGGAGDVDLMVVDWWPLLCWVAASGGEWPTIGLVPLSPSQPEFYSLPFCILFSFCLFGSGISPVLFGAPSCRSGWCGGAASSVVRGWNPVETLGAEEAQPPLPASAAGPGGRRRSSPCTSKDCSPADYLARRQTQTNVCIWLCVGIAGALSLSDLDSSTKHGSVYFYQMVA